MNTGQAYAAPVTPLELPPQPVVVPPPLPPEEAESLDVLLLEAELAGTRVKSAYAPAASAAVKLILARLSRRMTLIKELEAEAAEHRSALQSLAECWLPVLAPDQPRAVALPYPMMQLLRDAPVNTQARATPAWRRMFVELHSALLEDPETKLDGLFTKETTNG